MTYTYLLMQKQIAMLALFIAIGAVLVTGLIAIPMTEADAKCGEDKKPKKDKSAWTDDSAMIHQIKCKGGDTGGGGVGGDDSGGGTGDDGTGV